MSDAVITLPAGIDPAEAFSLFVVNQGNALRCAMQLKTTPEAIESMAKQFGWAGKLKTFRDGSSADEASDSVNRGVSFILGHRFRKLVEVVVDELQDPAKLADATTVTTQFGSRRDFKVLRDLGAALESACEITYRALGDQPGPANSRKATKGGHGDLVLSAMAAMDAAEACPDKSSTELVRQSLK